MVLRVTKTEEARNILNNPGKRAKPKEHEVSDILDFMPENIPLSVKETKHALDIWNSTLPSLIDKGIVHANDLDAFSVYCVSMGTYLRAAEQLSCDAIMLETHTHAGNVAFKENPLIGVMNTMNNIAFKWGKEFGLTPLSRGNVKGSRATKKSKLSEFVQ